ncbi:Uncharacterised protein [Klebsiella pneumoniae]|uniref:Uncharacterized protein n=1 Tax=Klebsiella pneumoniae TaxID=573 RepID=A0A377USS9_KLEPN|nr:Uncharacterised protein [Klebsiella pneumoniae]
MASRRRSFMPRVFFCLCFESRFFFKFFPSIRRDGFSSIVPFNGFTGRFRTFFRNLFPILKVQYICSMALLKARRARHQRTPSKTFAWTKAHIDKGGVILVNPGFQLPTSIRASYHLPVFKLCSVTFVIHIIIEADSFAGHRNLLNGSSRALISASSALFNAWRCLFRCVFQ